MEPYIDQSASPTVVIWDDVIAKFRITFRDLQSANLFIDAIRGYGFIPNKRQETAGTGEIAGHSIAKTGVINEIR